MTYIVIVAFVAILGSLAAALVFMMRGGSSSDNPAETPRKNHMARALAFRVGFSILLFLAGLRNIPKDLYEAAALDGATRWQMFSRITWPLIWPITVLCLTIQLILQLKIFDQVYLFASGGRTQSTMVLVQYIFDQAFVRNDGGYAAAIAVALFVIVVALSVFQYQILRIRGAR